MSDLQLYAVTETGVQALTLPERATGFDNLYDGLPVGVYSVFRTYEHNKFLCLKDHLARVEQSMSVLNWSYRLDRSSLRQVLHEVCTASPFVESRVRLDILPEPAHRLGTNSRALMALEPLVPVPARFYEQGVKVGFAPGLVRERPLAKTADFAIKRRAYPLGYDSQPYERLLVSKDGHILEGTGSNFYGVIDGVVWTAGDGVLEGIARKVILSLLPDLDIPLRLQAVHLSDIPRLDEAGMSSSSRALIPIVQIGDQEVANGRPGPLCKRILDAYNAFVAASVETAV